MFGLSLCHRLVLNSWHMTVPSVSTWQSSRKPGGWCCSGVHPRSAASTLGKGLPTASTKGRARTRHSHPALLAPKRPAYWGVESVREAKGRFMSYTFLYKPLDTAMQCRGRTITQGTACGFEAEAWRDLERKICGP